MKPSAYRVVVRRKGSPCDGLFLAGPSAPNEVKRDGYAFTQDPAKAWEFPTWLRARNKARIVNAHMRWDEGAFTQPVHLTYIICISQDNGAPGYLQPKGNDPSASLLGLASSAWRFASFSEATRICDKVVAQVAAKCGGLIVGAVEEVPE